MTEAQGIVSEIKDESLPVEEGAKVEESLGEAAANTAEEAHNGGDTAMGETEPESAAVPEESAAVPEESAAVPEESAAVPEVTAAAGEAVAAKEGAEMEEAAVEENADETPLVSEKDPGDEDADAAEEAQDAELEEKEREAKEKEGAEQGAEGGDTAMSAAEEERKKLLAMPPHGSEVFVGGVTQETTEEELKELCSTVGEVFEVRILKEKETGLNKGYAFVTFTNRQDAEKAIATLGECEIKGRRIRVTHSQSKHRLFVGHVPKQWNKEELQQALEETGPGITMIELLMDPRMPGRNRGFAFVDYLNHACAEHGRRNLSRPHFRLLSNTPTISWADPRPEPDQAALDKVRVLYVKGIPEGVSEERLVDLFSQYGEVSKVIIPAPKPGQPRRDFGFVHFVARASALKAIAAEKNEVEGTVLDVSLAKPSVDRPPPMQRQDHHTYATRGGLLPQYTQKGYSRDGGGGGGGGGYGHNPRLPPAYGDYTAQSDVVSAGPPMIIGRGAAPAGMTMVPMVLPDGRIGYVLQPPPSDVGGPVAPRGYKEGGRGGRGGGPAPYSSRDSGRGRRYNPY